MIQHVHKGNFRTFLTLSQPYDSDVGDIESFGLTKSARNNTVV